MNKVHLSCYLLKLSIWLIVFLIYATALAQNKKSYWNEPSLKSIDSLLAAKLPELKLPKEYILRGDRDLPARLNNADLPFFRPTFSQNPYWNCGQSAGIGYNFCYEINQSRELNGDVPENQQSINFTWNFMNTGDGWGVSYLQSFDILKACGNPNLFDYGGLFEGGEKKWMTGFELYENAMENRVRDVYYIDVSNSDGLLTLKHWLNDHLNNSAYGGVANIYLSYFISDFLPDESEEAGQPIIVETGSPAGHAITITGYNDSVRFDVNSDGRFTNNEDINDDGIIDMKDWEIGALRYKNSSLNNDGYGLIMYRTLALEFGKGGIWNNQAHIIDVKEAYMPLATMRLKIKHNSRNKLKLIAGVSQDTSMNYPQHSIDFPIFNYQGGDNYMQGFNYDESARTIEVSLDISSLMSFIEPGTPAKYFIQVAEKDRFNSGTGEVLYYSVVDFMNSDETVSVEFPKQIENNSITKLSLVSSIDFNNVEISTNDLSGIVPGEYSSCQITAAGGKSPYRWEVLQPYSFNPISLDLPQDGPTQLMFDESALYGVPVNLSFPFPYYNDTLTTITVFIDGFLMFKDRPFPYPYFIGEESMLRNNKIIAPFMSKLVLDEENGDGVWIHENDNFIDIIWKASVESFENNSELNFAIRLFSDGRIETHYGEIEYPERIMWSSGISRGDGINYTPNLFFNQIGNQSNTAFEYIPPELLPDQVSIDENGLLSMFLDDNSEIFDIVVQVTDDNSVTSTKRFQVPSDLIYEYEIHAGTDTKINYYDTVSVSFYVKNISSEIFNNIEMDYFSNDENIIVLKDYASIGTLAPQQSRFVDSALVLVILPGVPDQSSVNVSNQISSDEKDWNTDIVMVVDAPRFEMSEIVINDNQNGILDPGEEADLTFSISNYGHAEINQVVLELSNLNSTLIIQDPILNIAYIGVGETIDVIYQVKAKRNIPTGTDTEVVTEVFLNDISLSLMKKNLLIGKIPILILDLEPKHLSGPVLMELFDTLQLGYTYRVTYPYDYEDYMSVFICLGSLFNNADITPIQTTKLANFLSNDGNIYMEGRVAWNQSEPSVLHELFNIEPINASYYFEMDTIYGVENQFTEHMVFDSYSDKPYNNYYLQPIGSASPILYSGRLDSACAIAYNGGNYKTIGSSFEINNLIDVDTISSKRKYLLGILDFFELTDFLYSDIPELYDSDDRSEILAFPNPFSEELYIQFPNHRNSIEGLYVYNLTGQLINEIRLPDKDSKDIVIVSWDGKDYSGREVAKGFYILKLVTESSTESKKVLYQ